MTRPAVALRSFSNYSFLEGASFPEELVAQAAAFDMPAIALTDRDGMYGSVRAHLAAKEAGIKLLIGSTITRSDGPPMVLLAMNKRGYAAICRIISTGRHAADKGSSFVTTQQLCRLAGSNVIAIHPALHLEPHAGMLASHFNDTLYAGIARHMMPADEHRIDAVLEGAARHCLPLVAAPSIFFHNRSLKDLADILAAIRYQKTVAELKGSERLPNSHYGILHASGFTRIYHDHPAAVSRTLEVADRCRFSLDELKYHYPREVVPPGETPMGYLTRLTAEKARTRYRGSIPDDVRQQLRHELRLIDELGYPNYFLTMYDIVAFARSRKILCQGRGSAANSAVCYVLGITSIDPVRSGLLFERFISRERNEPPDIDVDFEHERREEVIQYIYNRYGRHRAAMVAEFIRYRTKSAIRDVGKALGFSVPQVTRMSSLASSYRRDREDWWTAAVLESGFDPASPRMEAWHNLVKKIRGFPRHLSVHVGGFVISDLPIDHLCPTEPARMQERTVIQWDKEDVEDAGLLKIDILGLGMLTCLRRAFDLLRKSRGIDLDLYGIPANDEDTYRMCRDADTVGVFQIESRAQMSMLPRLKPANFYDLVVEIAIIRPGPIQGKMVHPYLRRRQGLEPVTYPIPELEPVLGRTFGVPLFQEQVMKLAMVAGGFSGGEADNLRRAMGTWRSGGRLEGLLNKLVTRMEQRGIGSEYARRIADQIRGFGGYGFPESHAASFALLAYDSSYLKCHYPEVFAAALINSQPMGFYSPATIIEDARRHHVEVRGICVNRSQWEATLEKREQEPPAALRLGFALVRKMRLPMAQRIVENRQTAGDFRSFPKFAARTGLPTHILLKLALAGAFSCFNLERRQALWTVLSFARHRGTIFETIEGTIPHSTKHHGGQSAPMNAWENVLAELESTSVYLCAHPFELVYPQVRKRPRFATSAQLKELPNGRRVTVGGLCVVKQRPPTAGGVLFLTLEDHLGFHNLVIHADIMRKYRLVLLEEAMLIVEGRLEKADGVINITVNKIMGIRVDFDKSQIRMRDFR